MERKIDSSNLAKKSNLSLENRSKLTITGVIEVINFDEIKINLNTNLGNLIIKGQNLKMNKLDVQNGEVIICGEIGYMVYNEKINKKSNESIIKRFFK